MSGRLDQIQGWELIAQKAEFRPLNMAGLCSISERQLERHFQSHFKMAPRQWLRVLRCGLAKQLIMRGYSTKAVAADLYFANSCHFCREFKRFFGVSPQRFSPVPAAALNEAAARP
jgi:AraC-like DNA-binding protein